MTETRTQAEILDDRTPGGKPIDWRRRKMANEYLAMAYDAIDPHKAERLRGCANMLVYGVRHDPQTGEASRKLRAANFCRVRLCPICQWRRSLRLYSQMRRIMAYLADRDYRYIFLTLTIPSVSGGELSNTLDSIAEGYNRLTKYKEVAQVMQGWYRGLEITHNVWTDLYHPHLHILVAVRKSYLKSRYYLPQARWQALWERAMGLDQAIVDVRTIKGEDAKAVCEATKYAAKSADYIIPDDWQLTIDTVALLDAALDGRRLIGFGGALRDARRALRLQDIETGDLVDIDDSADVEEDEYTVSYAWHTGYTQYLWQAD